MKNTKSIKSINLKGKRVFLRVDLNVPLKDDGTISDSTRIKAILPTIEYALCEGAFIILCSHLGRPVAGSFEHKFSFPSPQRSHIFFSPLVKQFECGRSAYLLAI